MWLYISFIAHAFWSLLLNLESMLSFLFPEERSISFQREVRAGHSSCFGSGCAAEGVGKARLPLSGATRCPGITLGDKTLGWHQKKEPSLLFSPPSLPLSLFFFFFFKGGFLPSLNETLSLKDCNPQQMTSAPNLIFWQVILTAPSLWFLRHVVRHILICQSSSLGRMKKERKKEMNICEYEGKTRG